MIRNPIIFGEVLFDEFPGGERVLGGAPFNVAWHLHGFGLNPYFVSRIGNDDNGQKVLEVMRQWGMTTDYIQTDADHQTGYVKVAINNGQPSFDIVEDVAYDHIMELKGIKADDITLLYHGSLIMRSTQSAQSLTQLLNSSPPVFLDINLRAPYWNIQDANNMIKQAQWLKLNNDELLLLSGMQTNDDSDLKQLAMDFKQQFGLDALFVTCGEKGAFYLGFDEECDVAPAEVGSIVDTVGAGDAFSSVLIMGILLGWKHSLSLQRANQFAAEICEQRGATALNKKLYKRYIQEWS